ARNAGQATCPGTLAMMTAKLTRHTAAHATGTDAPTSTAASATHATEVRCHAKRKMRSAAGRGTVSDHSRRSGGPSSFSSPSTECAMAITTSRHAANHSSIRFPSIRFRTVTLEHTVAYCQRMATLTRVDWTLAAFHRLSEGGVDAVRIEPLAKDLGVS